MNNDKIVTISVIDSPPIKSAASSCDSHVIEKYLTDEAVSIQGRAERVFFPRNEPETASVIEWANDTGTLLTVRGGGTGITGSCVPQGGAVMCLDRFIRVREESLPENKLVVREASSGEISFYINEETNTVTVAPGILISDLNTAMAEYHLYYPPNPTEYSACIGGNIATNASGGRSFRNGAIRPWVTGLRVILPEGYLLILKRGEYFADEKGFFHIRYPDGKVIDLPIPGYEMPHVKNASGYHSAPGMDLIDLFIGAEGTLGVVTEAEIRMIKWEGDIFGCIVFFSSEEAAVDFVREAVRRSRDMEDILDALTLDYFDENSLNFVRNSHPEISGEAKAAVFFEQFLPEDPDDVMMAWAELMEEKGSLEDWSAFTDRDREKLRLFRHSLPESVNELVRRRGVGKMGMDLAVPDNRLEDIMEIYRKAAEDNGLEYVLFGHIGDNNLHMNFLPRDGEELEKVKGIYFETARKGIAMGGTISAEHGVGKKSLMEEGRNLPYIHLMYSDEDLKNAARMKKTLDPNLILNIGNILSGEFLHSI